MATVEPLSKTFLQNLTTPKALAMGCYGETLAAYRYTLLAEKADRQQDRDEFRAMVAEEQEHRDRLQALLDKYYNSAEFVLTAEEKGLVESGPSTLKITDRNSFIECLKSVIESERCTAQFYDHMEPFVEEPEIKAIFRELADEGVGHHQRLQQIARENNIST